VVGVPQRAERTEARVATLARLVLEHEQAERVGGVGRVVAHGRVGSSIGAGLSRYFPLPGGVEWVPAHPPSGAGVIITIPIVEWAVLATHAPSRRIVGIGLARGADGASGFSEVGASALGSRFAAGGISNREFLAGRVWNTEAVAE